MNGEKPAVQGFDVSAASVAVVGCGGLGTNVCAHLAGAGVGRLLLWDHDRVETRNLNRQFFYTPADAGKPKAATLAKRLRAYAPEIEIAHYDRKAESSADLAPAAGCGAVVCAADNIPARRVVWEFCEARGIPCVFGAVAGDCGTAFAAVPGLTATPDDGGVFDEPNRSYPSPGPTVGLVGALQAKLVIEILRGKLLCAGVLYALSGCEVSALPIKRTNSSEE